ncbi:unnamed protein product [Rhizophagus irregularis]|nr:unnamed protein product [Rhizophagus irregularis]
MPTKLNTICYVHNIAEYLTQEINNISSRTWNIKPLNKSTICNILPVPPNNFLLSQASDFINSEQWIPHFHATCSNQKQTYCLRPSTTRSTSNVPQVLNNFLIEDDICNSTIGIITDINHAEQYVRVAFSVRGSIIEVNIYTNTPTILPSTEIVPIGPSLRSKTVSP